MTPRVASRLAWSMWALTPALLIGSAVIAIVTGARLSEGAFVFIVPIFLLSSATVGALVASRHASNAIGWIFLATAVVWSLVGAADNYAIYAKETGRTSTLLARLADWPNLWFYGPGILLPATLVLLLFPDGRPASQRWRPVVWIAVVANVCLTAALAFGPAGTASDTEFLRSNPLGIDAIGGALHTLGNLAWPPAMFALFVAPLSLVLRLRRARGDEHEQLKWLAYAGVVVVITMFGGNVVISIGGWGSRSTAEIAFQLLILAALTLIPISAGVAILNHRLYDIDVVINKTVVYGSLAALVTLVYVAIVVGVGTAVGSGGSVFLSAVAAAVVALLFQPARRWAQRFANRFVYGRRATPYEMLSTFSDRLADAFSVDDVLPRMAHMVAEGTGSPLTRVWLAAADELRPVASWPVDAPATGGVHGVAALPDRRFEVRHHGELLGAITLAVDPREPITPTQEQLVEGLASQAGLVLRNVRLVDDLRESRRRIVAAQDARAKKLERDIHDGAQQQLVALAVKLGLVERLVATDPGRATSMLAQAKAETNDALSDLRDLARGISPPLLADKGLGGAPAALEGQARKSPIPVEVEPDGIGRYAPETEAAVYFSCLEALQNVAKYASATHATLRLSQTEGALTFEVTDDGTGFDPSTARHGSGLQGIADRLTALGGELTVRSAPGDGTIVAGRLPITEASP